MYHQHQCIVSRIGASARSAHPVAEAYINQDEDREDQISDEEEEEEDMDVQ